MQQHAGRVDDRRESIPVHRGQPNRTSEDDVVVRRFVAATNRRANVVEDAIDRELHEGAAEPFAALATGVRSKERVDRRDAAKPFAAPRGARHGRKVLPARAGRPADQLVEIVQLFESGVSSTTADVVASERISMLCEHLSTGGPRFPQFPVQSCWYESSS